MPLWELLDWSLFSSILDVVLVYFLIYRTLLLVRGTRAEPMLLGLGIVVIVYIISRELHLATLNWILGNFLGSVILVIVVLFQDDLRRVLTKVGLFPGFGSGVPEALERSIKEIARAAGELSSRRVGGLIVIRRDVGLDEYTEHAVRIDGVVTHQLLVSIFLPSSPLHDGAVVVEGDKIVAAGAVLPLTFSPSISGSFGTRHRAAIGLSERTDAVTVVISEETGGISLIRESRVTRDLNEKTLYNALHRLTVFRHQRAQRRKERRKDFWSSFFWKSSEGPDVASEELDNSEALADIPAEPDSSDSINPISIEGKTSIEPQTEQLAPDISMRAKREPETL